ncbi:MAG: ADP-dependent NAD(P)H-hydrate dehydratase / NAD(P)H-hydrate epimerase [Thermoanaerobaculia bacterium]|jgi:NAD(P)H-hydrate epimerase|nr:ADP-dependent NAD(P)H-hydrate dehydratase / NAD(P)H-hydrate epimerase [Thermoanaerobaculia bacterium]
MHILTSDQMKSIDRRTTERFGIPSIVLMENAAIAVVDAIGDHYPDCDRAAIFCGLGANGGDGFAIARHLEQRGVVPSVFIVGDRTKISGDAATNLAICERLALPMFNIVDDESLNEALVHASDADLVVDAIFGTGLNRAPEGIVAETIVSMMELGLPIVAVDLPSGANASSAETFEPCVQAALTVTFAAPKICHVFEPAAIHFGEVIVADIAIPSAAIEDENITLALTTPSDVRPHFAPRLASTHKGTYGHVAIIAGSPGRSGAAVLAARGAIRSGAGLVTVATDADTARLVNAGSIESMTYSGGDVASFAASKDAVLIGPGLPDDDASYARVRALVAAIERPLVIDASALNAFASHPGEINPSQRPRVLTPHPGELARLLNTTSKEINAHRIDAAREAARLLRCVVVLKGFQTLIAELGGYINVNPTGNPGMATGGMGDVLGGMIAALLARGIDPFDAAIAAVYLHGFTGDMLKDEMGDTGLTAGDLAERIPLAIKRLRET